MFKRLFKIGCGTIIFFFIVFVIIFSSIDMSPTKVIDGVEYSDYGFFNESDKKNPNIQYEPNMTNIVIGAVFFETGVAPFYVFGYHLMEPVGPKPKIPGQVVQ